MHGTYPGVGGQAKIKTDKKIMDPTTFSKLYSIFNAKRWHDKEKHEKVFSNFCDLLGNLNENQQNLLLELLERYTWLTFSEYQGKLIHIFENIPIEEISGLKKIILFPVMKPDDKMKTKSGHGVLIILRGVKQFFDRYDHLEFEEIENYQEFDKQSFTFEENERIFLLDDFLGSGKTIKETIEALLANPKITLDKIRVVTIASHKQAIEYMESIGVIYYTELITSKGISDHYDPPELEEKISIMKEIEKLLPTKKYSFGFGKSEALITLYRTPNNTFPIFWHDHEKNEKNFKAPFPRY